MSTLRGPGDAELLNVTIEQWAKGWQLESAPPQIEHQPETDATGNSHWLIRLRGDEKDVITVWLTLRQRTVYFETEVISAPEENLVELYRYLLVKNFSIRGVQLAIGPEAGIYLVASVPLGQVDADVLDELLGAVLASVDEIFPTAMSLGHASHYRRRPRNR